MQGSRLPSVTGDEPDQAAPTDNAARTHRLTMLAWAGVVLMLVVITGAAVYLQATGADEDRERPPLSDDLADVVSYEVTSDHVITEVDYDQLPPVGGPHNPLWLNCGAYEMPIPNENVVHSMEHGAVWIAYSPDLAESSVATLEADLPATYAVLSPYPDAPAPIVLSAWGNQLFVESADDPRVAAFVKAFRSSGEAPEIGAPCDGASDGTLPLDAVEQMQ